MKKQYLISLLGLAAISVPLGSSLLETNLQLPSPGPEGTGLIVNEENSKIVFYDMNGSDNLDNGDQLKSIDFETNFKKVEKKSGVNLSKTDYGFNLYNHQGSNPLEVSYANIENLGGTIEGTSNVATINVSIEKDENNLDWKIWNYKYKTSDKFDVTADYSLDSEDNKTIYEDSIGEITNVSAENLQTDSVVSTTNDIKNLTPTSSSVDYNIDSLGTNFYGEDVEVTKVEWIDTGKDGTLEDVLAIDNGTNGILTATDLKLHKTYSNTIIRLTTNDTNTTEAIVDEFTTQSQYENTIVTTSGVVENVSPTSSSVDYNVNIGQNDKGKEFKTEVRNVKWVTSDWTLETEDESNVLDEIHSIEPNGSIPDKGTLTATDLDLYTEYSGTKIVVEMSDGEVVKPVEVDPFITMSQAEDTVITTSGEVVNISPTSSSIDYNVNIGQNDNGNQMSVLKNVKWVTSDWTLETEDESNVLDEINPNDLDVSISNQGTLTATDLDLYTEYSETKIVVEMSDGEVVKPVEVDTFTTMSQAEDTVITTSGEVVNISPTSSSIDYNVNIGQNDNGNQMSVLKNVKWVTSDWTLETEDESNVLDEINPNDLDVSISNQGTLTATDLDLYTEYSGTKIVVEMSDGEVVKPVEVDPFTTMSQHEDTVITTSGEVVNISPTAVSVDYKIKIGKNDIGQTTVIKNVKWLDENGDSLDEIKPIEPTDNINEGTLTATGLNTYTTYGESTIVVEMSDGEVVKPVKVDSFTTESQQDDSVLTTTHVDEESITHESAEVNYNVELGLDHKGTAAELTEIQWIDVDNGVILARESYPELENGNGSLEATNLDSNKNYDNTKLVAKTTDAKDQEEKVDTFTTDEHPDQDAPTITSSINESKTTETSVTFDYEATNGLDSYGNNYLLTTLEIKDENGNQIEVINDADGMNLTGSITVDGLEKNTTYDNWTMVATFTDSADADNQEVDPIEIEPFTTVKNNLGAGAVIGIIIAVLLGVGIVVWAGNYLYKKYNESKPTIDANKQEQVENKEKDQKENKA